MADDLPVAVFASSFPAPRFPDLAQHLPDAQAVTVALERSGVDG